MDYLKKLREAESLIDAGEVGRAKGLLLEALEECHSQSGIDRILKNTNAILALEIIEQCYEKSKKKTDKYAKELEKGLETIKEDTDAKLEQIEQMLGYLN